MKFYFKVLIFFLSICLDTEAVSQITTITKFRFSTLPAKTRLVFEATHPLNYTTQILPKKIMVNIKQAKIVGTLNQKGLARTPISAIVISRNKNDLRLTLNLTEPVKLKHFILSKPHRVIFDLYPTVGKNLTEDFEQDLINRLYKMHEEEENDTDIYLPRNLRDVVVVIDPGHGGRDSGAVGPHGIQEKHVTLAVAKALQKIINNNKGFRAVLTRNDDYFIPLRRRLTIARTYKADIFISIHADAYRYRDAYGASVFALSPRGATSEAARWLAEKENESELGQAMSDKSPLLRSVLIDLAQTATISASLDIGNKVLRELGSFTSLHSHRVEQAAFVVLKSPDIPSLLVEVGFISYGKEELKLHNSRYQKELAWKLAQGIYAYFLKRPPQSTYSARLQHLHVAK
ncbi:MAG: N-acetylmuramoyl-L-alanine amidase [Coxiellaceae bacterium]|jgi:N-acetylmuramoyl-L-alanine amidase|nr:N-acetylmuramoyl-L-alanine amidase [Coxiellaceae bacterium]